MLVSWIRAVRRYLLNKYLLNKYISKWSSYHDENYIFSKCVWHIGRASLSARNNIFRKILWTYTSICVYVDSYPLITARAIIIHFHLLYYPLCFIFQITFFNKLILSISIGRDSILPITEVKQHEQMTWLKCLRVKIPV